ncbi:unnamed protein product [Victoria cruziana]
MAEPWPVLIPEAELHRPATGAEVLSIVCAWCKLPPSNSLLLIVRAFGRTPLSLQPWHRLYCMEACRA